MAKRIDHSQRLLSLGSCFAENIASQLMARKFKIVSSPTGILFNPESIAAAIDRFAAGRAPLKNELQYSDRKWFSYDFHSSFSHASAEEALAAMQHGIEEGAEALNRADTFIITFGTAIVYRLNETQRVVANCHKQPHNLFNRTMLSVEDVVARYATLLEGVLRDKQAIFTVSPIRHLGDGAEENSLSKATLRVAIGQLARRYSNVVYFPAFEIMNDELRDYRFYAEDMTHPSPTAIKYIWEQFSAAAFSPETLSIIERIEGLTAAVAHRPFDVQSQAHKRFCRRELDIIDELERVSSDIDLRYEKSYFKGFL